MPHRFQQNIDGLEPVRVGIKALRKQNFQPIETSLGNFLRADPERMQNCFRYGVAGRVQIHNHARQVLGFLEDFFEMAIRIGDPWVGCDRCRNSSLPFI